jgi:hypothetical protein
MTVKATNKAPAKGARTRKPAPSTLDEANARIAALEARLREQTTAPRKGKVVLENLTVNPQTFYLSAPPGQRSDVLKFGPRPIPNKDNPLAPVQQIAGDEPYTKTVDAAMLEDDLIKSAIARNVVRIQSAA